MARKKKKGNKFWYFQAPGITEAVFVKILYIIFTVILCYLIIDNFKSSMTVSTGIKKCLIRILIKLEFILYVTAIASKYSIIKKHFSLLF